jgi:hypothetical protein
MENLPIGLDGTHYRWVDLDGEGLPGILTEQGEAWFYMNGKEIKGTWKKEDFSSPLLFEDEDGYPMRFVPGQTFIQVIEPNQQHRWEID